MDKEKILQKWNVYTGEIFYDNGGDKITINKNMEGPVISEVRSALARMKRNKAAEPDEILSKIHSDLD